MKFRGDKQKAAGCGTTLRRWYIPPEELPDLHIAFWEALTLSMIGEDVKMSDVTLELLRSISGAPPS